MTDHDILTDNAQDHAGATLQMEPVLEVVEKAGVLLAASIRAAATLRLADHIGDASRDVDTIADLSGTDPRALRTLLRFLSTHGLLVHHGGGVFSLTETGRVLRSDHPAGIRALLDRDSVMARADLGMIELEETMRTRAPSHSTVFGRDFWTDVQSDPRYADSLAQFPGSTPGWDGHVILDVPHWAAADLVTDVAGGSGTLVFALLEAHPHLRARLLDLPNSVALARRRIDELGLGERCEAVTVDMMESIPRAAGVFVLSSVLCDWNDDDAVKILSNVRRAMLPGARLLIAEIHFPVVPDDALDRASAFAELYLEASVAAPDRVPEDVIQLAQRAGLELSWTGPSTEYRSLLEFVPRAGA